MCWLLRELGYQSGEYLLLAEGALRVQAGWAVWR